jgi:hypothetical protein
VEDHRRKIHVHLVERHAEKMHTDFDESKVRMFYRIECPGCALRIEKTIKPRGKDPGFLEEFDREIKLVAFDMLLNHMEAMHPPSGDGGSANG